MTFFLSMTFVFASFLSPVSLAEPGSGAWAFEGNDGQRYGVESLKGSGGVTKGSDGVSYIEVLKDGQVVRIHEKSSDKKSISSPASAAPSRAQASNDSVDSDDEDNEIMPWPPSRPITGWYAKPYSKGCVGCAMPNPNATPTSYFEASDGKRYGRPNQTNANGGWQGKNWIFTDIYGLKHPTGRSDITYVAFSKETGEPRPKKAKVLKKGNTPVVLSKTTEKGCRVESFPNPAKFGEEQIDKMKFADFQKLLQSSGAHMVKFGASWCKSCHKQDAVINTSVVPQCTGDHHILTLDVDFLDLEDFYEGQQKSGVVYIDLKKTGSAKPTFMLPAVAFAHQGGKVYSKVKAEETLTVEEMKKRLAQGVSESSDSVEPGHSAEY